MAEFLPDAIIERLRSAEAVTVLTGASISAESGIPTFRSANTGLWRNYDPTELATPQAFMRNPQLVWSWYSYRRKIANEAEPNKAHYALVDLEQYYPRFTLITQNVDGLHWRAGSRNMLELHGNITRVRCFDCAMYADVWEEDEENGPPVCAACGGFLRPDVLWFGEGLPSRELNLAYQAAQSCDIFLCIGTSAMVQPAASLPLMALRKGALVIEINLEDTALSDMVHYSLHGSAGILLPQLTEMILTGGRTREESV